MSKKLEEPKKPKKVTPVTVELAKLRFSHAKLEAEHATLQKRFDQLSLKETVGGGGGASPRSSDETDSASFKRLQADFDGLKKMYDELVNASDTGKVLDFDAPDPSQALAAAIAQRQKVESDLGRIKKEATRTIRRLKEKADTTKLQKDNLLKMLQSRDAQDSGAPAELTLEQITDSPVFKTMLGNIRRTSREEVTLLHDAIVKFGTTNPASYNDVLVMVAAEFKAVNVENPLALLKNLPTS